MGDADVKIDKDLFYNRLSHLYTSWKNDKRSSGDAVFGGVGSILVVMGKTEEVPTFAKSNALFVYPCTFRTPKGVCTLQKQLLILSQASLVAAIRIPSDSILVHFGLFLHRDDWQERCVDHYL